MKVETTNLTSLPICLAVIGIRTLEIAVQVRDRNLHTTNRQNDSEARNLIGSYPCNISLIALEIIRLLIMFVVTG